MHPNSLSNLKPWSSGSQPDAKGRKSGTRDKIGRQLLERLASDFETHGEAAIVRWREEHVEKYMAALVSLLPKEATLNLNTNTALDDLTVDQLASLTSALTVLADQLGAGEAGPGEEASSEQPQPLRQPPLH